MKEFEGLLEQPHRRRKWSKAPRPAVKFGDDVPLAVTVRDVKDVLKVSFPILAL